MKKKIVTLLLISALAVSGCGGSDTSSDTSNNAPAETPQTTTEVQTEAETETTADLSELDAVGDIEVEENLFTVELTIPADYVGEATQADLDASAQEYGYKSITLNADGSATYVMTKAQHEEMMNEMATEIDTALNALIGSTDYPNFTAIEANNDYTSFTITTKSTELDMNESFSVMIFYMYGGMYNIFNGTQVDNVHIDFVNADSGEIISSADSSDS